MCSQAQRIAAERPSHKSGEVENADARERFGHPGCHCGVPLWGAIGAEVEASFRDGPKGPGPEPMNTDSQNDAPACLLGPAFLSSGLAGRRSRRGTTIQIKLDKSIRCSRLTADGPGDFLLPVELLSPPPDLLRRQALDIRIVELPGRIRAPAQRRLHGGARRGR